MIHLLRAIKNRSLIRSNSLLNTGNFKNYFNEKSVGIFKWQLSTRFIQTSTETDKRLATISKIDSTKIAQILWRDAKNKVIDKDSFSLYLKELYHRKKLFNSANQNSYLVNLK